MPIRRHSLQDSEDGSCFLKGKLPDTQSQDMQFTNKQALQGGLGTITIFAMNQPGAYGQLRPRRSRMVDYRRIFIGSLSPTYGRRASLRARLI